VGGMFRRVGRTCNAALLALVSTAFGAGMATARSDATSIYDALGRVISADDSNDAAVTQAHGATDNRIQRTAVSAVPLASTSFMVERIGSQIPIACSDGRGGQVSGGFAQPEPRTAGVRNGSARGGASDRATTLPPTASAPPTMIRPVGF